jgi:hypothetical protein
VTDGHWNSSLAGGTAGSRGWRLVRWRERVLLAGLLLLVAIGVPLLLMSGPRDTCASSGIATPVAREGVCVRGGGLFESTTTYNVVDSGHILHMPGYDAQLLASTSRVTTVYGSDTVDYPGGTGLLVSYEVSITNPRTPPLLFDATARDTDLAFPDSPGVAYTGAWRQTLTPQGAPSPQLDQQGTIPAHGTVTGWLSFVVPLRLEQYLNTRPADLEFFRPGQERGYVGQIRLWKWATSQGEAALQANQPQTMSLA